MKIKGQTFAKGIITVLISQILVKFLGFIYRVVITNLPGFGDEGNAYYGTAYKAYALLLAIATTGIPTAISKLVAEKIALGDKKGAYRIFKVSLSLFIGIAFVFFLILLFGSKFISTYILVNTNAFYSIIALSPALLFVAISAVFRGFFTGLKDMKPQGISQVLEQIFNCIFSILFVTLLISKSPEIMAVGSALGTTLATVVSAIYLFSFYMRRKNDIKQDLKDAIEQPYETKNVIVKNILKLAIPISFSSVILTLSGVIDLATVKRCLIQFMTENEANTQIGILFGKVDMLTNLPLALNVAFAMVLVPTIASSMALGNKVMAKTKSALSLLITILIGLSCTVGLYVLAEPILKLLFPSASDGTLILQISALATIFSAVGQTLSGTLQGLGKVMVPVVAIMIGSIVKLVLNLILIPIPSIGIYGAAISSIVGQMIIAIILFRVTKKSLHLELSVIKYIIKPILATLFMGITAYLSYHVAYSLFYSNVVATLLSVTLSVFVFAIAIFILKIFSKEEIESLPMGNKINQLLVKLKID